MEEYMRSRHHNTLIVKHDESEINAFEKAKAEIKRNIEKKLALMAKANEDMEKAKERGEKAIDKIRDESELKRMEEELKELRVIDGLYRVEEGRKKDAATIEMPYTLMESRKTNQAELEKAFEDEFLHGVPIDFTPVPSPRKPPVPHFSPSKAISMKIIEKPIKEEMKRSPIKPPTAGLKVIEKKAPSEDKVIIPVVENVQTELRRMEYKPKAAMHTINETDAANTSVQEARKNLLNENSLHYH